MPHEFEVRVDSAMMKAAWHAWYFRGHFLWRLLLAFVFVLVVTFWEVRTERLSTSSIVLLTVMGLALVIFVVGYWVGLRRYQSKLEMIIDGKAAYRLTEETIEAKSSLGAISLGWSAIAELRGYRDLILIGFRGALYSVIPASQISAETLAFMVERCRASGARITDL